MLLMTHSSARHEIIQGERSRNVRGVAKGAVVDNMIQEIAGEGRESRGEVGGESEIQVAP
jgi:hypothetical protein